MERDVEISERMVCEMIGIDTLDVSLHARMQLNVGCLRCVREACTDFQKLMRDDVVT